ncbi:hypothetical protein [Hydrogenophaga sp.]|uniref:hypothetical protein n=1 Tax=Hydrogenophaga sp. TaxID=1904254 RepID=UPI00261A5548|nr:hypothetical protein [Hydrogenophaga sp.]MDM7948292.1 hypothetical protein [Hydrogenophaga sp.]
MKTTTPQTTKTSDDSLAFDEHRLKSFKKSPNAGFIDRVAKTRLSKNFILRDFLFCASSAAQGLSNFPDDLAEAIKAGQVLCDRLLEPILAEFGRFAVTYGYQSRESMDLDLAKVSKSFRCNSSSPHHWDRGTFGNEVYARVDILPFCVEDGYVGKRAFGHWVMHHLDVDLCMTWKRSNVFCLTIGPKPRRCWIEWGRPAMGERKQEVVMGADYWQNVYPTLPMASRPKFGPSATNGSLRWGSHHG